MSEQQFAFAIAELVRVSCTCEHCGTLIIFDITHQRFAPPSRCLTCNTALTAFADAIQYYRQFFQEAEKMKTMQLRTKPTVVKES